LSVNQSAFFAPPGLPGGAHRLWDPLAVNTLLSRQARLSYSSRRFQIIENGPQTRRNSSSWNRAAYFQVEISSGLTAIAY
jgi:hypothetical protein